MRPTRAAEAEDTQATTLRQPSRRQFIDAVKKYGFTAACVAYSPLSLGGCEKPEQAAKQERTRERTAEYTMNVATGYVLGASRSYPIMQLDFKENVQNLSQGRIHVKLLPAGQLGTGSAAVQKVQTGTLQAAQHSLANFAPFAPAVDLINIPYWCSTNQRFVNLVTSKPWRELVQSSVEAKGFRPLWYVPIDPRSVALRRGTQGPARTPEDVRGIKFRVPGSKVLAKMYRLFGANPTPVAWGETSSALKQGVADAVDPSAQALLVSGFQDILSWITFNRPVPDSQVYSCNAKWFKSLPRELQDCLDFASEVTFRQNLAKIPSARAYAMKELSNAGVQFYTPSEQELQQWKAAAGHQLPVWDELKRTLAGSYDVFDSLYEAAGTPSNYYVHDLS